MNMETCIARSRSAHFLHVCRVQVTHELAGERTGGPETASLVEEGRDLSGDTAVTTSRAGKCQPRHNMTYKLHALDLPGRGTEDDTVGLLEIVGLDDGVLGVERRASVHLLKHFLGEGLLATRRNALSMAERALEAEEERRVLTHMK